jgi:hypothetical protein
MNVLILAKTHMSGELCVGGLARDTKQNIRLLQPGGLNQPVDTPYQVGQVWEMDFTPCPKLFPPHVEDVIVHNSRQLGRVKSVKETLLAKGVKIWQGRPAALFDGLLQFTPRGAGYIAAHAGVPRQSVGFWRADRALVRSENRSRIRYHTADYKLQITYVGTADAPDSLPDGVLLRVSLARWWRADDADEARCYLQLSGWFL